MAPKFTVPLLLSLMLCLTLAIASPVNVNTTDVSNALEKRQVCLTAGPGSFTFVASNQAFLTCTGGFAWVLQASDANFVVYQNGVAKWASYAHEAAGCASPNKCTLTFQSDGNLVQYFNGQAIWNTGTYGGVGKELVFQTTVPYLYILNSAGAVVWES